MNSSDREEWRTRIQAHGLAFADEVRGNHNSRNKKHEGTHPPTKETTMENGTNAGTTNGGTKTFATSASVAAHADPGIATLTEANERIGALNATLIKTSSLKAEAIKGAVIAGSVAAGVTAGMLLAKYLSREESVGPSPGLRGR